MMLTKNKALNESMKNSVITRILMIGILIPILLLPCSMIESVIDEREDRRISVIQEINATWGLEQTITGPILEIPYKVRTEITTMKNNKLKKMEHVDIKKAYFLPDQLTISGDINPETRYRGIYKSTVYTADLEVNGVFNYPNFEKWKIDGKDIVWDEAVLAFGITEMRGINKTVTLGWNDSSLTTKPGVAISGSLGNGVHSKVAIRINEQEKNTFAMKLNIRGSNSINFLPMGRDTQVNLSSKWNSPSFNG
ncbi:MAG: cell envelope integrity protein CreD, partial [bacterium]|nr:cell envelope integrity protein CreD [bacterium]